MYDLQSYRLLPSGIKLLKITDKYLREMRIGYVTCIVLLSI